MAKLKTLRERSGLTQAQVADYLRVHTPQISLYESGTLPDLEDAVILEKKFGQRIDWKEDLSPLRKHQTIQAFIELVERYPLPMVLEFGARVYRREVGADSFILHYANVSCASDEQPLTISE
jgi:transcriptional regulator with XRE-family HTH domain